MAEKVYSPEQLKIFCSENQNKIISLLSLGFFMPPEIQIEFGDPVEETADNVAKQLISHLQQGYVDMLESGVEEIRISGGLDSRLLMFLAQETNLFPNRYLCLYNPILGAEKDRDVLIATACFQKLHKESLLSVEKNSFGAYFAGITKRRAVGGGLFGTELMGGCAMSVWPMYHDFENGQLDSYLNLFTSELNDSAREHILKFKNNASFAPFVSLFTRAERSLFHNSIRYSWTQPSVLFEAFQSPFQNKAFLKRVSLVPKEQMAEYKMYQQVWNLMGDFLSEIPLNENHFGRFREATGAKWGENPELATSKTSHEDFGGHRDKLQSVLIELGSLKPQADWSKYPLLKTALDHILYWYKDQIDQEITN
ncbi:MAG: hypothetical protein AAF202_02345 [Pseudomonadota bacterium]